MGRINSHNWPEKMLDCPQYGDYYKLYGTRGSSIDFTELASFLDRCDSVYCSDYCFQSFDTSCYVPIANSLASVEDTVGTPVVSYRFRPLVK